MLLPGQILFLCGQQFKIFTDLEPSLPGKDDVVDKSPCCCLEGSAESSLILLLQGWVLWGVGAIECTHTDMYVVFHVVPAIIPSGLLSLCRMATAPFM